MQKPLLGPEHELQVKYTIPVNLFEILLISSVFKKKDTILYVNKSF